VRQYNSLRKQNNGMLSACVTLALCVLLSGALLFGRLLTYTTEVRRQSIPLTRSSGITRVVADRLPRTALPVGGNRVLAAVPRSLTASPGFSAYDKDTVWSGETHVEIFSLSYDNETGQTTVHSQDGLKVLAPGTGNTYEFALENTGNVSLDYTMEMDAWYSDTEYPIPVQVRVTDGSGGILLGSPEEMVDVLRLSEVRESGVISRGYVQNYDLQWQWPFEKDDAYDTLLGNLAAEGRDLTLTVVIRTTASCSLDPQEPGGEPPQTGDTTQIALYAVLMVGSMAGLLAVLLLRKKEEGNEAN